MQYPNCLGIIREARSKGLTTPVLLMGMCYYTISSSVVRQHAIGYFNPLLAYGEDKAIQDAAEAGANGFIMVDLPPEEAVAFREKCIKSKYVCIVPPRILNQLFASDCPLSLSLHPPHLSAALNSLPRSLTRSYTWSRKCVLSVYRTGVRSWAT